MLPATEEHSTVSGDSETSRTAVCPGPQDPPIGHFPKKSLQNQHVPDIREKSAEAGMAPQIQVVAAVASRQQKLQPDTQNVEFCKHSENCS
jgi:hypothetical protein